MDILGVLILYPLVFASLYLIIRYFRRHTIDVLIERHESNGVVFDIHTKRYTRRHISRKRRMTYVTVVTSSKIFPNLFVDSLYKDKFLYSSEFTHFHQSQKVALEGDYNDFFQLYAPKGLENDALVILTPDVMQLMKDELYINDFYSFGTSFTLKTNEEINVERYKKGLYALLNKMSKKLTVQTNETRMYYYRHTLRKDTKNEAVKIGRFVTNAKYVLYWGLVLTTTGIYVLGYIFLRDSINPSFSNFIVGFFISLALGLIGVALLEADERGYIDLSK
ncbi:hypothetical protein KC992_01685 [Candidatus Saccharibacteria bacterium]|nr:hypothetical protein [Candidatus Saccharibacteria bacterium]